MKSNVTVDYVNAPKPDKSYGSIKCGEIYYGYDTLKFTFQKGESYNIVYSSKDVNGRTYFNITGVDTPAAPTRPQSPVKAATAQPGDREARLAIATACIQSNQNMDVADLWLAWVKGDGRDGMNAEIPF